MNNELKKELETLKSPLASIDKQFFGNGDAIPVGFFERQEDDFFQRIRTLETPREASRISIFSGKGLSYSIAAMASFAILGLGIFAVVRSYTAPSLSENEVKSYLEEEGDFLAMDNTATVEPNSKLKKISDVEIKDYLCEVEGMSCEHIN